MGENLDFFAGKRPVQLWEEESDADSHGMLSHLAEWRRFRWPDMSANEAARLSRDGVRGHRAMARLLLHDLMPDYRQRPKLVAQTMLDTIMACLWGLEPSDLKALRARMMHDLGCVSGHGGGDGQG